MSNQNPLQFAFPMTPEQSAAITLQNAGFTPQQSPVAPKTFNLPSGYLNNSFSTQDTLNKFWNQQKNLIGQGYLNTNMSVNPNINQAALNQLNYSPVPPAVTGMDNFLNEMRDPSRSMAAKLGNIAPVRPLPKVNNMAGSTDTTWYDPYIGEGKLFKSGGDALQGVGSLMQGIGTLSSAWAAIKGLDMAENAMNMQNEQWNKNYEAQRIATNNAIANQNAWKAASGRTDLGSYVGDWSNAQNLQTQTA